MHQHLHAHLQAPQTLEEALAQLHARDAALAQLHAAHESFLRAVAHDLRAPLRHLTSFAPLLRESLQELVAVASVQAPEAAEEAQEFLGTMGQSARKMSQMLDALMQLSRAARQPLQPHAVDVAAALRQAALRQASSTLDWAWQLPEQPVALHVDGQALDTVLDAVLGNAVKFSAKQSAPQVHIRVQQAAGGWQLQVQDNGVGMDGERLNAQYPPFQRLHRDSDFSGVGCGLSLAHVLLQRHGAQLQLQSQPGMGCTVTIVWPVA